MVDADWDDAFLNQVEARARRAKLGNSACVDLTVPLEERDDGQLVEDDDDDRCLGLDGGGLHLDVLGEDERLDVRAEEEEHEEDDRRRGEHGHERAHGAHPPESDGAGNPGERRGHDQRQHGALEPEALEGLDEEDREQEAGEDEMEDGGCARVDEPDDELDGESARAART